MKKEHKPSVFFVDPSDENVSKGTKKTIETFLEFESEPVDTNNLSGDYKKIIDIKYGQKKQKKK